jgi:prepilin-type N-terminal cleavage/methylation domain-containing protein
MAARKGFTLTELIVVIIIVGISAAFAIPKFIVSIEKSKAQSAQNNLLAISAAQSKFFEDYASYCINTGANPTALTLLCGDSLIDLNRNLHLGMSGNDSFIYTCDNTAVPYNCTASDVGIVTLTTSGLGVACTPVGSSNCPN